MLTTPSIPQPLPLDRKYKDAFFSYCKTQGIRASLITFLISYLSTTIFILRITSLKGLLWTFFQQKVFITSLLFTIIITGLGFLRFTQTSVWRPKYLSAGTEIIAAFRNQDYYIMTTCYALAGITMVRLCFTTLLEESYTSHWFTYPPGHRAYARELNKENLFITFYGLLLGIGFSLQCIIEEKNILRISPIQQPKGAALKASMSTLIHSSWKYAGKMLVISYILFIFFNGMIYYMVAPFIGLFWSSLLVTPVVRFRWYDLYLMIRMMMTGSFVTFGWEIGNRVFDVVFAVIPNISLMSTQPNACLLDGLRNKDNLSWIRSTAYGELALLATKEPDRRISLFLDTSHDFTSSAWKSLSQECMLTLNTLRQRLNDEYMDKKTLEQQKQQLSFSQNGGTERHFTSIQRVTLQDDDMLVNDDDDDDLNSRRLDDRTPELFLSQMQMTDASIQHTPWATTKHLPDDKWVTLPRELVRKGIHKITQSNFVRNLMVVTIDQKTRAHFSNTPDLIYAIQALGSLTAASLKEDPYGYVQHDIPNVLDTLLGTLMDVEHFIQAPPKSYQSLPHLTIGPVLWTEPNAVIRALNDAIFEITTTFKEYMNRIKVQKKYQARLRTYI
ncbi:nucleoporin protein Ndc1-Nup [Halteromyces radiatus]|uniref:nucleoporin protein Ndc1-Nup n=1 Tax=Halteromyces radiatus TaxID=101107 RepID=UPI00221E3BBF|nr:nucleoporin protein Ndc1-Nup [Halteromyces radiatus]KAI8078798.1 nucleoporin protein Ndc1-Nup [Halteromyces radiatus]